MLEPGAMGDWTFKDLAAYITGWRARSLQRLEAAANGNPEPAPVWPADRQTDDEINDWLHERNTDRLLGEVIGESRESYARLAEIVQMLPDDALNDPDRFPWLEGHALGPAIVNGEFFSHVHEEHEHDQAREPQAERERERVALADAALRQRTIARSRHLRVDALIENLIDDCAGGGREANS